MDRLTNDPHGPIGENSHGLLVFAVFQTPDAADEFK